MPRAGDRRCSVEIADAADADDCVDILARLVGSDFKHRIIRFTNLARLSFQGTMASH